MRVSSLFMTLVLAASACAGGSAYVVQPDDPPPPGGGPIAVDPPQMPPHVFNARPVPVKNRPAFVQPPDLSTLPKLVRSNKCTRSTRGGRGSGAYKQKPKPYPKPYATPSQPKKDEKKAKKKTKKAANNKPIRPYLDDTVTEKSAGKAIPSATAPASQPRPGGTVMGGGGVAGADSADFSSVVDSAPSAQAEAGEAYSPRDEEQVALSRREQRKVAKDKRKHDRAASKRPVHDDDMAAGAALEPMPAEDEEYYEYPVEPYPPEPVEPNYPPPGQGWGDATYLSNDDTMSLSSAQRIAYAIDAFLPLPLEHIRPHELLNYFSFETAPVEQGHDFSVKAELAPTPDAQGLHTLALSVQGRPIDYKNRRNAALTLVVDRSGSMREEGRIDYLKQGLQRMVSELKTGDVINLVTFDDRVCSPLQGFVVGRDDPKILRKAISSIRPRGYTDIHSALTRGYELADRAYMGSYSNRVLLITDALANTGVTDAHTMSLVADWYDARRIRLSGIGVGREFNDRLLDRMTEKGRGAYVFLGSSAEVDAVFGANFVSLIETTANDVHFRLHLPPALRMYRFHGEESSTYKEDVQAIHYFANTSQLFLADLEAWEGNLRHQDWMMLEIEYGDPDTGDELVEEYAFRIGDIAREGNNVKKSRLVTQWVNALAAIASTPPPPGWGAREHGWMDPYASQTCREQRERLATMARGLNDAEVTRMLGLWDRYCLRYDTPNRPPRKDAGPAGWPGARG